MRKLSAMFGVLLLSACSFGGPSKDGKLHMEPVAFEALQGWQRDNQAQAFDAFQRSCAAISAKPETAAMGEGKLLAPIAVWKDVCRKALAITQVDDMQARLFFEQYFVPVRALNGDDSNALFTGYYEPLLKGSKERKRPYVYPIYGVPPADTPAYTRSQIDFNALVGRAPELAYVDDPVQLYFLHVQGSGRIQLEDGSIMRVGYAASNGLPYVSIGKKLVERDVMTKEQTSMQSIKQWLYDHPNDMWQLMWENTSYVFFRQITGDPIGTQGIPITAERTLAVDAKFIPLGTPVFIDTILPTTDKDSISFYRRLFIAQDTGGAIKGPTRGDIFFGFGPDAEARAGKMRSGGSLYLLLPKPLAKLLADDS